MLSRYLQCDQRKLKNLFHKLFGRVKFILDFSFFVMILSAFQPLMGAESGVILKHLNSFGVKGKGLGELRSPKAVEIDGGGCVYVIDNGNSRVVKFSPEGKYLLSTSGWGESEDRFRKPVDIALDGGLNLFIADYSSRRIVRIDREMNFVWDVKLNEMNELWEFPLSIALSEWGELFILEAVTSEIIKLDPVSFTAEGFGGYRSGKASTAGADKIAVNSKGLLYINQPSQRRIGVYDRYGNYIQSYPLSERAVTVTAAAEIIWISTGQSVLYLAGSRFEKAKISAEETADFKFHEIIDIAVSLRKMAVLDSQPPYIHIFEIAFIGALKWDP